MVGSRTTAQSRAKEAKTVKTCCVLAVARWRGVRATVLGVGVGEARWRDRASDACAD
jgi:hypothetical protein